jgi:hypothetical protein
MIPITESDVRQAFTSLRSYDFGQSTEPLDRVDGYLGIAFMQTELRRVIEKELIEALDAGVPPGALKFVCQKLWSFGTVAASDALVRKLADRDVHVVEAACFAIGQRPSQIADEGLGAALARANGVAQVALIQLAGDRRAARCVPILAKIATEADRKLSAAAVTALGKIATADAMAALSASARGETAELALLQAATSLQPSEARALLRRLETTTSSPLVRRGAQCLLASPVPSDEGFRPLFNGRDLSDFVVDTAAIWSVRNGVIIARSPGLKYNEFLRTREHYQDFTLHARLRLIDGAGNSGFQFRSKDVPGSHEVAGYQADAGERYWGNLYDESRRAKILAGPDDRFLDALDPAIWHSYVVTAHGDHIRIEVDGIQTVDYTEAEPGIPRSGFIALQVHAQPTPVEMWFKDLRIRPA